MSSLRPGPPRPASYASSAAKLGVGAWRYFEAFNEPRCAHCFAPSHSEAPGLAGQMRRPSLIQVKTCRFIYAHLMRAVDVPVEAYGFEVLRRLRVVREAETSGWRSPAYAWSSIAALGEHPSGAPLTSAIVEIADFLDLIGGVEKRLGEIQPKALRDLGIKDALDLVRSAIAEQMQHPNLSFSRDGLFSPAPAKRLSTLIPRSALQSIETAAHILSSNPRRPQAKVDAATQSDAHRMRDLATSLRRDVEADVDFDSATRQFTLAALTRIEERLSRTETDGLRPVWDTVNAALYTILWDDGLRHAMNSSNLGRRVMKYFTSLGLFIAGAIGEGIIQTALSGPIDQIARMITGN